MMAPDASQKPPCGADVGSSQGAGASCRGRRGWLRLAGRAALALAGLAAIGFFVGLLLFSRRIAHAEPMFQPATDGVVTLTGGAQRIGDALHLLREGRGKRLLISGVNERTRAEEITRLHPGARDLVACCVDLGTQARNTIGNSIETRRWTRAHEFRSITVVTSNYHMPRALLELTHVLPDVQFTAYPVVTETFDTQRWWREPAMARALMVEYVKYLAAYLRTRIELDPEISRFAVIFSGRKPVSPKQTPGAFGGG